MGETELIDPRHSRRDMKMVEAALKRPGFEIGESVFKSLALHMSQIVSKGSNREKTAAARVLLAMAEFNRANEPGPAPQTNINVGVKIDARPDSGGDPLLALTERIAARRISGEAPGG